MRRLGFIVVAIVLAIYQSGCIVHEYLEGSGANGIDAAVDEQGCRLLAESKAVGLLRDGIVKYRKALKDGKIIIIKDHHLIIKTVSASFYEGGRFVPIYSTAAGELEAKHIVVVNWVIPKEGAYAGRTLCIVDGLRSDAPSFP